MRDQTGSTLFAEAGLNPGGLWHGVGYFRYLAAIWCRSTHNSIMWPIHGEYMCRICSCRRLVPWA